MKILLASVLLLLTTALYAQSVDVSQFAKYSAHNLETLNSSSNDFAPCVSPDGQTMIFISERGGKTPDDKFWMSQRTADSSWGEPIEMTALNIGTNCGAISMTADGKTFFFASSREHQDSRSKMDLWHAYFGSDGHLKVQMLSSTINNDTWNSQPSVTADGKTLYFASNREDKKHIQIYVTHMLADSSWTEPKNLGSKVNRGDYTGSPFITRDGRMLYFCSRNRPGAIGGLDIYQATKIGPGDADWSDPVILPAPINSPKNDFFFFIPASGNTVYFSSDRDGKMFDIFSASPPKAH